MYRKNTAGQFLCVQMILTATGAVATGLTLAARRCLDGTFAAATGTFTEDGATGSYKFALSQADTNANNVSIIVTGTGAIPVCVNFVTTAADPTDSVRFGLTALPNAAAEAAGGLYTRGSGAGQIAQQANGQVDVNLSTIKTQAVTCAGGVTVPAATLASTTNITAGTLTTVTTATNLTTNNDKTGYALTSGERNSVADAILDRDMSTGADSGSTTVRTVRQALRFNRNKVSIAAGTMTVTKEDDVTASWTAAITTTAGDPITSIDPAGP